ncbi:MAG: hypothetical protein IPK50_05360 [Fibrobacterota bacterium]|nr:MAG: hypothetical protein IPK50_05360 [Fibrobacterota bacterium]
MFPLPTRALWLALSLAFPVVATTAALPANLDLSSVPDPLRPWIPWVLRDLGESACPGQDEGSRICIATSKLSVQADKQGATFTLSGTRFIPGRVYLPGDSAAWPVDVRDRGLSLALVGDEEDQPFVERPAGAFVISGRLAWKKRPASISLPTDIAVRTLQVDGKVAAFDADESRMWLETRLSEDPFASEEEGDEAPDTVSSLEIRVQRLVSDGSPMELTTTLELTVGGKERRIQLPGAIPVNARAVALNSPLAGRLDGKGGLELTLRPGTWSVLVRSVLAETPKQFEVNKAPAPWPEQEVWSFQENANLRGLAFEGASPVNPIQAGLDPSLGNLPAWSLDSSHPLRVKVVREGAIHPDSMKISLSRTLYIDAQGKGATIHDRYNLQDWRPLRFSLRSPLEVSSIKPDPGTPALITTNGPNEAGINLYQYAHAVEVQGRMQDGFWQHAPASAVESRLEKLDMEVKAPAGWWILALTGIDGAEEYSTWRSLWTQGEVVFAAILVGLLYLSVGRLAALLAIGFLVAGRFDLISTSSWICLAIVLFVRSASERLSEGHQNSMRRILTPLLVACMAWCAWSLFLDSRQQWIRIVHPTTDVQTINQRDPWIPWLASMPGRKASAPMADTTAVVLDMVPERPQPTDIELGGYSDTRSMPPPPPSTPSAVMSASVMDKINTASDGLMGEDVDPNEQNMIDVILAGGGGSLKKGERGKYGAGGDGERMSGIGGIGLGTGGRSGMEKMAKRKAKPDIASKRERDPFLDGAIQTGPGIPQTQGPSARLESAYPMASDASVRIWTLGTNSVRAVRLFGMVMGWLLLIHVYRRRVRGACCAPTMTSPTSAAMAFLLLLLSASPASAQTMPSPEMLEELQTTLTRAPECGESCVDISRISVKSQGSEIRLECTLQALASSTVQLPQGDWTISDISCPTCTVGSSGQDPFAVLTKGTHTLAMTGKPSGKEVVFSFPVRPRVLEVTAPGWSRIDEGRASMHLVRGKGLESEASTDEQNPARSNIGTSPFVRIERSFQFSREWTVITRLVRATQFDGAIAIDYPLLAGEATLDGQAIDSGKARWVLPSGESSVEFHTRLRHDDSLVLVASTGPWSETWSAQSHPRLQILHRGMPVTQRGEMAWTPFPGDTLKMFPKAWPAAKGPMVTILGAELTQNTDPRDPSAKLVLRTYTSQGSDLQIRLPDEAQLEGIYRDGTEQIPNKLPDGRWNLSLTATTRQVTVKWRTPDKNWFIRKSPRVEISTGGVNFSTTLYPASDRFVLLAGGQGNGVRCLWWSFLPLFFAMAWLARQWSGKKISFVQASMVLIPISSIDGLGTSPMWLFAIGLVWLVVWRSRVDIRGWSTSHLRFVQAGVLAFGAITAIALLRLLASPLMGSPNFLPAQSSQAWTWVFDRSAGTLPSAWVVSLPTWSWKVALGIWLVWLGRFALPWIRSGWSVFTQDGVWPQAAEAEEPFEDDHEYDSASDEDSRRDD